MIMKQVDIFPHAVESDQVLAARSFEVARTKNQYILGLEAFNILEAYGIPVVKTVFAKTVEEAVSAAKDIGYPLVMNVVYPQISHKPDIGGIRFPLLNASDVKAAYQDIMEIILKAVLKFKSLLQQNNWQ